MDDDDEPITNQDRIEMYRRHRIISFYLHAAAHFLSISEEHSEILIEEADDFDAMSTINLDEMDPNIEVLFEV